MPNAVLRSLTGLLSSASARSRRGANPCVRGAARTSRRPVACVAGGEVLEDRRLFALAVTPLPAATPATALAATLLVPNSGITVTGGTYVGQDNQGGTYTDMDMASFFGTLSIQNGVLLTTGTAADAVGPNDQTDTATARAAPGDPDLAVLTNLPSFDANSLTLNFTTDPTTRTVMFDFIFGSEEYPEFIGNVFNDVFAAYLDGVQISYDFNTRPINVSNNLVSVNNVNGVFTELEYDGLTRRVRTTAPLNGAVTNHTLKFVIADTGNDDYDSGVFLARLQGSVIPVVTPTTDLPTPGGVAFSADTYTVDETAGAASILVTRVGGTSGQVAVNYAITAGTATDLLDFTSSSGTLIFSDGQTSQALVIPILDDVLPEGDETAQLTLSAPVDAALSFPSTATLTILDNERTVQILPQLLPVDETVSAATITVSRSGPVDGTVTVQYATSDGAPAGVTFGTPPAALSPATQKEDYLPTSGTLTFADGQRTATFTVPIIGDFLDEEPEFEGLTVTLSNPVGSSAPVALGGTNAGVGTVVIINVDRPPSIYDITAFAPSGRIEALYLKMNDSVDAVQAIDPATYDLYQHAEKRFNGPPSRRRVGVRSVDYNPTLRTLLIRPMRALKNNVFYEVTVRGTTDTGLRGITNESLDGNLDRVPAFGGEDFIGYFGRGTRLTYNDRDGSKVKLGATGGGVIEVFRDASRDARTVRYLDAVPASAIFGTVKPTWRGSDRTTDIGTLILGGARNHLGNPPFRVGAPI